MMIEADKEALTQLLQRVDSLQPPEKESPHLMALLGGVVAVSGATSADVVAEALLRSVMRLFDTPTGCLWRYSGAERTLSLWMRISESKTSPLTLPVLRELAESTLSQSDYVIEEPPPGRWSEEREPMTVVQWPVRYHDRPFGVLQVATWPAKDTQVILMGSVLARQAAIALARLEEVRHLSRRASMLETLRQVTLNLTSSLDLTEVLSHILESVDKVLQGNLENAHIFLYEDKRLIFGAARFRGRNQRAPIAKPRPDGLTARVARQGRPIVVLNTAADPLFGIWPAWHGSIVGLPLKIGDRVVGVMNVAHRYPNAFGTEELQILQLLADQAAIAIENARLHRVISSQAITDELTNLPNRRALDTRLDEEIRRAKRYGGAFCLMMIDLNGFKQINDRFGHPVGDKVLRQIAGRLRKALRESDFLARYGGDEFAVLLPQTDLESARAVARKVSDMISGTPVDLPDPTPTLLTLGIGVASFPEHGETALDLIRAADNALYVAKDHPSRNIQTFTEEE